jgi:hypothetical protein
MMQLGATERASSSSNGFKTFTSCATVTHTCNVSYTRGRNQDDDGSKTAWAK